MSPTHRVRPGGRAVVGLIAVAVFLISASRLTAQPNLSGRWTPVGNSWRHMQVHMSVLPGDAQYHSKIVSWQWSCPVSC